MCWQHILAPGWSGPLLVAFLCIRCPFTIGFCHLGYCYTTPVSRQRKMTCQLNTLHLSHFDFCLFSPFSFLVRFWNQSFLLQEDCTLTKNTHFQKHLPGSQRWPPPVCNNPVHHFLELTWSCMPQEWSPKYISCSLKAMLHTRFVPTEW